MILYTDHLRLALRLAIQSLKEEEEEIGGDFRSGNREVLEKALDRTEAMDRGEAHVEIRRR